MNIIAKILPAVLVAAAMAVPAHASTRHMTMSNGMTQKNLMRSGSLEGQQVIGMNGHRLGYVLAVNDRARLLDVQTPGGIAVSLPESRVREFGGQLFAINMSRGDMLALERAQTRHTVAQNIDMRNGRLRG